WGVGRSLQFDHLLGQVVQRRYTEPLASFAKCRASRRTLATKRLQPLEHLAITIATAQAEADDEPHHEPRRQPQIAAAGVASAPQYLLDSGAGNDTLECTHAFGGRQLRQRVDIRVQPVHRGLL